MNEEMLREMVPLHMHQAVRDWIEKGWRPGSFLEAVLNNDLKGAMGRADDINRHRVFDIVTFFYNFAPSPCWGSPEKVDAWEEKFSRG